MAYSGISIGICQPMLVTPEHNQLVVPASNYLCRVDTGRWHGTSRPASSAASIAEAGTPKGTRDARDSEWHGKLT